MYFSILVLLWKSDFEIFIYNRKMTIITFEFKKYILFFSSHFPLFCMYQLQQLYTKHSHGGRNVLAAKESEFSLDSSALIGILSKVNIYIQI